MVKTEQPTLVVAVAVTVVEATVALAGLALSLFDIFINRGSYAG
jgi:hypothetical protein